MNRKRSRRTRLVRNQRRARYYGYPGSGDFLWDDSRAALFFFPQLLVQGVFHGDTVHYSPGTRTRPAKVTRIESRSGLMPLPDRWSQADVRREFGLPERFSPEVEEELERVQFPEMAPGNDREDLTSLYAFTIDPPDARDHDDAVSIERNGPDVMLGVHIADVSAYVESGSELDREALARGTSVYLLDGVVPMLPEVLSSDLCSLLEDRPRLTLSALLTYEESGRLRSARFTPAVIRSRARLSYQEAQSILDSSRKTTRLAKSLSLMSRLAKNLRANRLRKGSLDFDLEDIQVSLSEEGDPLGLFHEERLPTHFMIEEFMLAANKAVARRLEQAGLPLLWRVHAPPEHEKVLALRRTLLELGIVWIPETPVRVKDYQLLSERLRGLPQERVLMILLLQSLMKAEYTPEHERHFGLGFEHYTHFTSPIRRYPDLYNHRLLKTAIGRPREQAPAENTARRHVSEIGWIASDRERWAISAERASLKEKICLYLKSELGEIYAGVVSGIKRFGFFVMIDKYGVEGLVPIRSLPGERYRLDRQKYEWVGERSGKRFHLGKRVHVQLIRVDEDRRFIDFELADEP